MVSGRGALGLGDLLHAIEPCHSVGNIQKVCHHRYRRPLPLRIRIEDETAIRIAVAVCYSYLGASLVNRERLCLPKPFPF